MRRLAAAWLCLLLPGCAAAVAPAAEYRSPKGYRVRLPSPDWRPGTGTPADLELRREAPAGGMVVDATCGGHEQDRPLPRVLRHLTFGLDRRRTIERSEERVAGLPAARAVLAGSSEGAPVGVEAVVVRGPRCVYDFLYVAPAETFAAGRADFRRLVDSLAVAP